MAPVPGGLVALLIVVVALAAVGLGLSPALWIFAGDGSLFRDPVQRRYYAALLAGVICNVTEAVNLSLTGGTLESDFVFPYYLISFGIAILLGGLAAGAMSAPSAAKTAWASLLIVAG